MEGIKRLRAQAETDLYYFNQRESTGPKAVKNLIQDLKNIMELENVLRAYKESASESSESRPEQPDEPLVCGDFFELNDRDSPFGRIMFMGWAVPCEKWLVNVFFPDNDKSLAIDKGMVQMVYEMNIDEDGEWGFGYDKKYVEVSPILTYMVRALHDGFRKYQKDKVEGMHIYKRLAPLMARAVTPHLPEEIQNDPDWKRACRDYVSPAPKDTGEEKR